jgi:hypothetical protein
MLPFHLRLGTKVAKTLSKMMKWELLRAKCIEFHTESNVPGIHPFTDPVSTKLHLSRRRRSLKRIDQSHTLMLRFVKAIFNFAPPMCRDSSVGIALGYGLDDGRSRFRFPAGAGNFSLHHRVQNVCGAHPASYLMGTMGSFPGCKAAGA